MKRSRGSGNSLALTLNLQNSCEFSFDHSQRSQLDATIWDVNKNHEFYKSKKNDKPCSKVDKCTSENT